jgi:hypothetical protein
MLTGLTERGSRTEINKGIDIGDLNSYPIHWSKFSALS